MTHSGAAARRSIIQRGLLSIGLTVAALALLAMAAGAFSPVASADSPPSNPVPVNLGFEGSTVFAGFVSYCPDGNGHLVPCITTPALAQAQATTAAGTTVAATTSGTSASSPTQAVGVTMTAAAAGTQAASAPAVVNLGFEGATIFAGFVSYCPQPNNVVVPCITTPSLVAH